MNMDFESRPMIGIMKVRENRIDSRVAIAFKDRFRDLVSGSGGDVILDLSRVDFIDSSGLGAIIAVRKLLGSERQLELAGLQPAVNKVMTLTRMHTVFAIHTDAEAAAAARGAAIQATS
ncbi:STAS domain-containing protein [Rhodobacterales bacterium LSUCC0031]|nr:STAS domain-containing protein [Rhodobacterales bacterium LSUCC0031]